ncbi:hypothetical protein B0H17DRAFT_1149061 [Mycena rosella]|uniref:Uncharacterized protein n=1 Tax=Mycena rosella TaxID=1033263 RepID=A0AAD7C6G9_MYCRO|nr:hypothetical protein B0H17DRAFT_1149061 [Mycena rosella]
MTESNGWGSASGPSRVESVGAARRVESAGGADGRTKSAHQKRWCCIRGGSIAARGQDCVGNGGIASATVHLWQGRRDRRHCVPQGAEVLWGDLASGRSMRRRHNKPNAPLFIPGGEHNVSSDGGMAAASGQGLVGTETNYIPPRQKWHYIAMEEHPATHSTSWRRSSPPHLPATSAASTQFVSTVTHHGNHSPGPLGSRLSSEPIEDRRGTSPVGPSPIPSGSPAPGTSSPTAQHGLMARVVRGPDPGSFFLIEEATGLHIDVIDDESIVTPEDITCMVIASDTGPSEESDLPTQDSNATCAPHAIPLDARIAALISTLNQLWGALGTGRNRLFTTTAILIEHQGEARRGHETLLQIRDEVAAKLDSLHQKFCGRNDMLNTCVNSNVNAMRDLGISEALIGQILLDAACIRATRLPTPSFPIQHEAVAPDILAGINAASVSYGGNNQSHTGYLTADNDDGADIFGDFRTETDENIARIINRFVRWIEKLAAWMRTMFYGGADTDRYRVSILKNLLDGVALEWYIDFVESSDVNSTNPSDFVGILYALHHRFITTATTHHALHDFDAIRFRVEDGPLKLLDELDTCSRRLRKPMLELIIRQRFMKLIPAELHDDMRTMQGISTTYSSIQQMRMHSNQLWESYKTARGGGRGRTATMIPRVDTPSRNAITKKAIPHAAFPLRTTPNVAFQLHNGAAAHPGNPTNHQIPARNLAAAPGGKTRKCYKCGLFGHIGNSPICAKFHEPAPAREQPRVGAQRVLDSYAVDDKELTEEAHAEAIHNDWGGSQYEGESEHGDHSPDLQELMEVAGEEEARLGNEDEGIFDSNEYGPGDFGPESILNQLLAIPEAQMGLPEFTADEERHIMRELRLLHGYPNEPQTHYGPDLYAPGQVAAMMAELPRSLQLPSQISTSQGFPEFTPTEEQHVMQNLQLIYQYPNEPHTQFAPLAQAFESRHGAGPLTQSAAREWDIILLLQLAEHLQDEGQAIPLTNIPGPDEPSACDLSTTEADNLVSMSNRLAVRTADLNTHYDQFVAVNQAVHQALVIVRDQQRSMRSDGPYTDLRPLLRAPMSEPPLRVVVISDDESEDSEPEGGLRGTNTSATSGGESTPPPSYPGTPESAGNVSQLEEDSDAELWVDPTLDTPNNALLDHPAIMAEEPPTYMHTMRVDKTARLEEEVTRHYAHEHDSRIRNELSWPMTGPANDRNLQTAAAWESIPGILSVPANDDEPLDECRVWIRGSNFDYGDQFIHYEMSEEDLRNDSGDQPDSPDQISDIVVVNHSWPTAEPRDEDPCILRSIVMLSDTQAQHYFTFVDHRSTLYIKIQELPDTHYLNPDFWLAHNRALAEAIHNQAAERQLEPRTDYTIGTWAEDQEHPLRDRRGMRDTSLHLFPGDTFHDRLASLDPEDDNRSANPGYRVQLLTQHVEHLSNVNRREIHELDQPTRLRKDIACLSAQVEIAGTLAYMLFDSSINIDSITPEFARATGCKPIKLKEQVTLQLGCVGSRSKISFGTRPPVNFGGIKGHVYFDQANSTDTMAS